jgi:hypothetical protein
MVLVCSWADTPESSSSSGDDDPVLDVDPYVFVCSREASGVEHFERIADITDFRDVPKGLTQELWRANRVDLWIPTKDLAEQMLECILADISSLVKVRWGTAATIKISGA